MRTCHGALLLAVAMVLLSTGMCTVPAPGSGLHEHHPPKHAPVPGPGLYSCYKVLYSDGCDAETCLDKCFSKMKGDGICIREACKCSYKCPTPPLDI
ncbi:hypothetical protein SETIT_1G338000v2 [Setaria italica]|uniref:Knottin scorpion toxin-like domain-containing protein n=1 Tax=Setaria italica TaxID=4555 RepID=A0A368PSH3_SETIT|nr:hypothetical protein SETIT_1G338000v2 [Setaria italica]